MYVGSGIVLIAATLYIATLAYALRGFSRARLSERLGESGGRRALEWLDRWGSELQALTGFVRGALNLCIFVWVYVGLHTGNDSLLVARDALWPLTVALAILLFASIGIPHAIALHASEAVIGNNLFLLKGLRIGLWPVGRSLSAIEFIVRRLMGKDTPSQEEETVRTEQEILGAVEEGKALGAVDEEQGEMIESIFSLRDKTASAIMTPRTEIDAIKVDATYAEVIDVLRHGAHSRLPVYEHSLDHIVGVLYAKDLIGVSPEVRFDLRKFVRPVPYVPASKPVDALLDDFRKGKVHMAIVLDEYGGTAGLVTIEDVLEELVGEIDDEYDETPAQPMNRIDDDTLEVDARVHVTKVNDELGLALPDSADYETIGGFVFATLGRIPAKGEEFTHENVQFHVIDAEPRKINRLRLHVLREAEAV